MVPALYFAIFDVKYITLYWALTSFLTSETLVTSGDEFQSVDCVCCEREGAGERGLITFIPCNARTFTCMLLCKNDRYCKNSITHCLLKSQESPAAGKCHPRHNLSKHNLSGGGGGPSWTVSPLDGLGYSPQEGTWSQSLGYPPESTWDQWKYYGIEMG